MVQDEVQTAPRPAVENSDSHYDEPGNSEESEEENADGESQDEPDDDSDAIATLDGTVVSVPPDDDSAALSYQKASEVRMSA